MFARIENGFVKEIFQGDVLPEFHPFLVWVRCPEGTKEGSFFDGESFKSPEEMKTKEDLIDEKVSIVSQIRNKKYKNGFAYKGKIFQCDLEAQKDMMAIQIQFIIGVKNPHRGFWKTANNESMPMDDDEVKSFFQACFAYVYALKDKAWKHKENLEKLSTKQEIIDYDIEKD